jgi:hypothetical protein
VSDLTRGGSGIPLIASAAFYGGDEKVFETEPIEHRQINTPDRRAVAVELEMPLFQFQPGYYTCQLNVIDSTAGRFVLLRLPLLIR